MKRWTPLVVLALVWWAGYSAQSASALQDNDAAIAEALSAGMPSITNDATIKDWEGNTLREGTNGWVCMPSPSNFAPGSTPMCLDEPFQQWADAWANMKSLNITSVGLSYMLKGDAGASNTDPYATGETADNDWVVTGPHLMLVVPDASALDGFSDDPNNGGPFVMWKGTPYAHVMIPLR